MSKSFDVAVIGAGVFGAWTAWHLAHSGLKVILIDAYGPAHSRASSGGESRIIRMGYGADELYTRFSQRSLIQWQELFAATSQPLFHQTGVLWLAPENSQRLSDTTATLTRCSVPFESLDRSALQKRFPQFALENLDRAILETHSGVLLARRAVAAVVADAQRRGVEFRVAQIATPHASSAISEVSTASNEKISAAHFVFACGAWLGKIFPDLLASRIFPTRQEVFFFAPPSGDSTFSSPAFPTWLIQDDEYYGMPNLESRGFKLAFDHHGPRVDPDTQSRIVSQSSVDHARPYLARRFPTLANAPLTETRVCQYENTSNGDFLVDRHPEISNLWFAGGGSGHGFKHGPEFGKYVAAQITQSSAPEPRFSLASKATEPHREVF